MELKRVVVTGLGAVTPLGNSVAEFWQGLINGHSGAAPITHFNSALFKTQFACEVKGFDPEILIDRKEARKMDRFAQFAVVCSDQAIADSGIKSTNIDPDEIGVIWGSGIGGIGTFGVEMTEYIEGGRVPRFNPFFVPKMILDIASGHISMRHGFRGVNFSTVSACASATHAIIDAFTYIRLGKAKVIITGGSEAGITEAGVGGFNAMKALSTRNEEPEKASRPYDKDRDGFVLGEGGACLVLEEMEHALSRGAKIYAELVGGGMSADAYHLTAPHPDGLGAKKVMENALLDANMASEEVAYINTHGTSTPLGDIAELRAIASVFGSNNPNLVVSSTKSMTGHLLGGAGAIESVASILAIKESIIPPTINNETPDPDIPEGIRILFNKAEKREIKAALSNTFGFGGHNAAVIFRKF